MITDADLLDHVSGSAADGARREAGSSRTVTGLREAEASCPADVRAPDLVAVSASVVGDPGGCWLACAVAVA
ncbi:hypothetical protein [Dactylosporangium cerinum]